MTQTSDRLEKLEERIADTSGKISDLRKHYDALMKEKSELENEIKALRSDNDELKTLHKESNKSLDKEEVRTKIDRMLEKFGELQL